MSPHKLVTKLQQLPTTERFPALFVGHGSPMNGIEDNTYVLGWKKLGKELPRPLAILSISAHWLTEGTRVHINDMPRTIHDFYGFPKELYDISYNCPGTSLYAGATEELIKKMRVTPDTAWGLDHGTWIVLSRMYPDANIPVFQMSIDMTKSHEFHYQLAKELSLLRRRGVLILGSGNIVHNLRNIDFSKDAKVFDWAHDFDSQSKTFIELRQHEKLIAYDKLGHSALLAIPTPDHYWPLLYILGLQEEDEGATFPIEGISHGSISMRSVLIK